MTINSNIFFKHNINILKNKKHPIVIGWKLINPENIGNIIRIADNFNCEKVIFVKGKNDFNHKNIKRIAQSSFKNIDWIFCNEEDLKLKIPIEFKIIGIETSNYSKNIYSEKMKNNTIFIVGNEKLGLDKSIIKLCSKVLFIPTFGKNKSMNVSHALTVALSQWIKQNYY